VHERLRLFRSHALDEQLALAAAALVERQRGGSFDRVHGFEWSDLTSSCLCRRFARRRKQRRVCLE
jgi:hypothetical protein